MGRKKKQPEPGVIRLTHVVATVVPGFTITNVSEADLRLLHSGSVPEWIHQTAAWWLRDNPKPGEVMPEACDPEYYEQQKAEVEAR